MNYINQQDANLLTWEENPKKRNENNAITFYLKVSNTLKQGDTISMGNPETNPSCSIYTIEDVVNVRPDNLTGFNHCSALTSWRKGL